MIHTNLEILRQEVKNSISEKGNKPLSKKYRPVSSETHRKSPEHGSSIPANESGAGIYSVPIETSRNLSKPAVGYNYRIPASNSSDFLVGSNWKRRVSWKFFVRNSRNTASEIIDLGTQKNFSIFLIVDKNCLRQN